MTLQTTPLCQPVPRPLVGALLMVLAMLVVPLADVVAKVLVLDGYSPLQTSFQRMTIGAIVLLPLVWRQRTQVLPHLRRPLPILMMGGSLLGAITCYVLALEHLPIANTLALSFVQPFFIMILSRLFLAEAVGLIRWVIVLVGFAAVVAIIRPAAADFHPASILPVLSAACMAVYVITIRRSAARMSALSTTFCTHVASALLAAPLAFVLWRGMGSAEWLLILELSAIGLAVQYLIIKAYELAEASLIAPLTYTEMVGAIPGRLVVLQRIPRQRHHRRLAGPDRLRAADHLAGQGKMTSAPGKERGRKPPQGRKGSMSDGIKPVTEDRPRPATAGSGGQHRGTTVAQTAADTPPTGDHSDTRQVGETLRLRRQMRSLSLKQVAEPAGISVGMLSQVERGLVAPSIKALRAICTAMDMPVNWLFHRDGDGGGQAAEFVVPANARRSLTYLDARADQGTADPRHPAADPDAALRDAARRQLRRALQQRRRRQVRPGRRRHPGAGTERCAVHHQHRRQLCLSGRGAGAVLDHRRRHLRGDLGRPAGRAHFAQHRQHRAHAVGPQRLDNIGNHRRSPPAPPHRAPPGPPG
jgi:drug/metabolite transporter (DMT)-like permease/transcriptional regulator with XRE-family HTH domain